MHRSLSNSRIGSAVLALGTMVIVTCAVVALATRGVGELPAGAELVGWGFAVSASVAAIALGYWARRRNPNRTLIWGTWRGAVAMVSAGLLTVLTWSLLFYGSGSYDKGGYARIAVALLFLFGSMVVAIVLAARVLARATLRDLVPLAGVVTIALLSFVGTIVLLPIALRGWA